MLEIPNIGSVRFLKLAGRIPRHQPPEHGALDEDFSVNDCITSGIAISRPNPTP